MWYTVDMKTVERPHVVRLRVSQQELDWIREYGDREDRSISWVLRHALQQLVEQQPKKAKR